ncbi:uncharacterized protein LOC132380339 [Hypanus sabinus]|uniref:uncharacterized protein LOC132380339 n=1 Tax=Hypanus sabinus TaxID=79690 RepID=UPI0028C44ACE|nr:uncharacterized protein LOC132380339 [Hypanus sabinus]
MVLQKVLLLLRGYLWRSCGSYRKGSWRTRSYTVTEPRDNGGHSDDWCHGSAEAKAGSTPLGTQNLRIVSETLERAEKIPVQYLASLPAKLQPEAAAKTRGMRKKRRLPPTPGGLSFKTGNRPGASDKIQNTQPSAQHHFGNNDCHPWRNLDQTTPRKSVSADDNLSQLVRKEQQTLLSRIGKGRRKTRRKHSLRYADGREFQQKK